MRLPRAGRDSPTTELGEPTSPGARRRDRRRLGSSEEVSSTGAGRVRRTIPRQAGRAVALLVLLGALLVAQAGRPLPAHAAGTGPTAVDDSATTSTGYSVTLAGATNDHAGSAALRPGLTVFPTDGQPTGSAVSDDGRTVQVAKHGTFVVNPADGSVTFTAWTRLTGTVSVHYRVVDVAGNADEGLLTVVVTAGGTTDDVVTDYGTEFAVTDLLANDTPGKNADGTPGVLDRTSVRFDDYLPFGGTVSDGGRTVTLPHLGVATVDDQGLLTWRADPSTSQWGNSADVDYDAQDTTTAANGTLEHHTYSTRVVLGGNQNTNPYRVLTTDDHATTPFNASVTLPGGLDDHSYYPTSKLRPDFSDFATGVVGPGDYLSPDRRKIRYPGRGTWTINADGSVLYVPRRGFVGTDAVNLRVVDDTLEDGYEELVVTVEPGPRAAADTATTPQNVTTSVSVLANDTPGTSADGRPGAMDATFVRFPTDPQPTGSTVSAYARTLTVPGEGVYTADRSTGALSFDPEPGFVGTTHPVTYTAQDTVTRTDGRVVHNPVSATLTLSVTPILPVVLDNWTSTTKAHPVDIPVLANDKPGAASAPLVVTSVRLRLTPSLPDGSRLSSDAKTLTVAGDGTFAVEPDGTVVFTPAPGFVGRVPSVGYQVSDTNGSTGRATITVQVQSA